LAASFDLAALAASYRRVPPGALADDVAGELAWCGRLPVLEVVVRYEKIARPPGVQAERVLLRPISRPPGPRTSRSVLAGTSSSARMPATSR
jgi:hypothetical protein